MNQKRILCGLMMACLLACGAGLAGAADKAPIVSVTEPEYCSQIQGDTTIKLSAPAFKSVVARCWQQGDGFGKDCIVATINLDQQGNGSFVFPAEKYPHGPITVRLQADNGADRDVCYLQLYNKGGVSWNEGMPEEAPAAARGMKLIFADDFTGPLSISSTDPRATYYDHKPPNGSQDFSTLPFTSADQSNNPFSRVDTYLRIRASEKAHSAGLISSLKNDGSGIKASIPCYFECRFIAPNAIGTWPAFWLMTDYLSKPDPGACDELDIIEAYGGQGPHEPDADYKGGDAYMITPHYWGPEERPKLLADKAARDTHNPCHMAQFGIPSTWCQTFHTYGCKVTETQTTYYCDNIEVAHHKTLPTCKVRPLFFMVNLATGGGWPVDLSRYNGVADMYVDYIRVYGNP